MEMLLIAVVSGIASGSVYGLIGLGLVIIFRSTQVINFALASMALIAVYVGYSLHSLGLALVLALIGSLVVGSLGAVVVREGIIRPLGQNRLFAALVATMGLSIVLDQVMAQIWGSQPLPFPQLVTGSVNIGGDHLEYQTVLIIIVAGLAVLAVALLFQRTPIGTAMRAVAESQETSQILGIKSARIARVSWALGVGLATLGAFLIVPDTGLVPTVLAATLFRSFAGIFLGGLTSMAGAVVGGVIIGVLDNLAATYVSASFRDTFVFSIAVLILIIRPQGLFGRAAFERV